MLPHLQFRLQPVKLKSYAEGYRAAFESQANDEENRWQRKYFQYGGQWAECCEARGDSVRLFWHDDSTEALWFS